MPLIVIAIILNICCVIVISFILYDEGIPRRNWEIAIVFMFLLTPILNLICLGRKLPKVNEDGILSSWMATSRMRAKANRIKAEAELNELQKTKPEN